MWSLKKYERNGSSRMGNSGIQEVRMIEFIVYQKGETRVYIHKGRKEKGQKLCWYGIRRDDNTGLACLLGLIRFSGKWRQHVAVFEPDAQFSSGCLKKICEFIDRLNKKWRKSCK